MKTPTLPHPIRSRTLVVIAASVTLLFVTTASSRGQSKGKGHTEGESSAGTINKPFEAPDVKAYISRFESDDREVFKARKSIVGALGLKPGMAVADVGAGTGLFTRLIAEKVGGEGKVFAVDVSRPFLEHIGKESARAGLTQVEVVNASQRSTGLAQGSIDLAFLCDTYHHLENPTLTLNSLRKALRPGGQLVVIDFDRVKGKSTEFVLKHVRADKSTFIAEIKAAGFEPLPVTQAPPLKENFFLRFRRTDDPAPPPRGPVGG